MIFNSGNALGNANDGQILAYNPVSNAWFFNEQAMAPNYGSGSTYHSVIEYSSVKNVAVYGGGNVAPNRLWRLNQDGTFTTMPNVPAGKAVGIQNGLLVNEPVSGLKLVMVPLVRLAFLFHTPRTLSPKSTCPQYLITILRM